MRISLIFGTRPEVIKLASVIAAFNKQRSIEVNVCFTGQHREMVLPLLDFFGIKVDKHLNIMEPDQTLAGLSGRSIMALEKYYNEVSPDVVFVQGDTTTAMSAATAAFYKRIKIAHVEAGLRTNNMYSPFPEEFNRQVISKIAHFHFAPTERAKQNLLAENIAPEKITVTGNTVIDALVFTLDKTKNEDQFEQEKWIKNGKPIILITGHRRENFGEGFENICEAIKELALKYTDLNFVYPVHLNPNVQEPVKRILGSIQNVYLIAPLDYVSFTRLMARSYLIITDSGGVQEEAPTLKKPVLIMRDTTERPEAVEAGTALLTGTNKETIVTWADRLLTDQHLYDQMTSAKNPFGDGHAAERIVETILKNI